MELLGACRRRAAWLDLRAGGRGGRGGAPPRRRRVVVVVLVVVAGAGAGAGAAVDGDRRRGVSTSASSRDSANRDPSILVARRPRTRRGSGATRRAGAPCPLRALAPCAAATPPFGPEARVARQQGRLLEAADEEAARRREQDFSRGGFFPGAAARARAARARRTDPSGSLARRAAPGPCRGAGLLARRSPPGRTTSGAAALLDARSARRARGSILVEAVSGPPAPPAALRALRPRVLGLGPVELGRRSANAYAPTAMPFVLLLDVQQDRAARRRPGRALAARPGPRGPRGRPRRGAPRTPPASAAGGGVRGRGRGRLATTPRAQLSDDRRRGLCGRGGQRCAAVGRSGSSGRPRDRDVELAHQVRRDERRRQLVELVLFRAREGRLDPLLDRLPRRLGEGRPVVRIGLVRRAACRPASGSGAGFFFLASATARPPGLARRLALLSATLAATLYLARVPTRYVAALCKGRAARARGRGGVLTSSGLFMAPPHTGAQNTNVHRGWSASRRP